MLCLFGAIAAGVLAYSCLKNAMRTGAASSVIPFRYTRLIFGITLGTYWFGERFSFAMWIGAVLILLSGLFTHSRTKMALKTTLSPKQYSGFLYISKISFGLKDTLKVLIDRPFSTWARHSSPLLKQEIAGDP